MILPAQKIRNLCQPSKIAQPLITPFHERTTEAGMTFGLSPAGYDVRIAEDILLYEPNSGGASFLLASTMERFHMPNYLVGYVKDKSTWARRGMVVQNTVIEPGWHGYLTLELTNHSNRAIEVKKGSPIAQIIFHRLEDPTQQPYDGRYQDQQAGPQEAKLIK